MKQKVVVLSPQCDANDVGESWSAYHWLSGLSRHCELTLLTVVHPGHVPPSEQLPGVRVIEWPRWPKLLRFERLNATLKPWYADYYWHARSWLKRALKAGERIDLVHQLTPAALRYPVACAGLGVPYVIGPVAGGLETPKAFRKECGRGPAYMRLRGIDSLRRRFDPLLRRSYEDADLIIGSAPYASSVLNPIRPRRFEVLCEVGMIGMPAEPQIRQRGDGLRLIHVGRCVRTKGLRDTVRAMARLKDVPGVTLDSIGDGDDLETCKAEAADLGVDHMITFHGHLPHEDIAAHFKQADLFVFPSFREPVGIVLFEALQYGLPVVTTAVGGPGFIVTDSCGIRVPVEHPSQLARDVANAVRLLAKDKARYRQLSHGAWRRAYELAYWPNKIETMISHYETVVRRPFIPAPVTIQGNLARQRPV